VPVAGAAATAPLAGAAPVVLGVAVAVDGVAVFEAAFIAAESVAD
jgi:hypothetical protein